MHLLDLARPCPEPAEEHAGEGPQEPLRVVRGALVYLVAAGVLVDVLPPEHAPAQWSEFTNSPSLIDPSSKFKKLIMFFNL